MIAAGKLPSDVPPDFGYVTDAAQKKAREQLANLVPNAKHITNTNSGHEIHKEHPQLVIDAIRQVVEAVRSGDRQLARAGFGLCASDMSPCHCLVESKTAGCLSIMHHLD
jgi:hypothetical protein